MVRTANDRIKINMYFQNRVLEGMRRIAEAKGTTYSELIREACREYVIREGAKVLQDNLLLKDLTK